MHVVSVPGRLVRHPVTRRVIDARGTFYDPFDVSIAQLLAHGDLDLVETPPASEEAPPAVAADASEQE